MRFRRRVRFLFELWREFLVRFVRAEISVLHVFPLWLIFMLLSAAVLLGSFDFDEFECELKVDV